MLRLSGAKLLLLFVELLHERGAFVNRAVTLGDFVVIHLRLLGIEGVPLLLSHLGLPLKVCFLLLRNLKPLERLS